MAGQLCCDGMCKIWWWSCEQELNHSKRFSFQCKQKIINEICSCIFSAVKATGRNWIWLHHDCISDLNFVALIVATHHRLYSGIILWTCRANERRRYKVKSSLISCAHTQNDPCVLYFQVMKCCRSLCLQITVISIQVVLIFLIIVAALVDWRRDQLCCWLWWGNNHILQVSALAMEILQSCHKPLKYSVQGLTLSIWFTCLSGT